mmetsp:Transcript_46181/g.83166  ORF Transcript_46181/g.83166 Transcript_46181/m.83166 type:complete len:246 (+) Transcript_46181:270-1007(+)
MKTTMLVRVHNVGSKKYKSSQLLNVPMAYIAVVIIKDSVWEKSLCISPYAVFSITPTTNSTHKEMRKTAHIDELIFCAIAATVLNGPTCRSRYLMRNRMKQTHVMVIVVFCVARNLNWPSRPCRMRPSSPLSNTSSTSSFWASTVKAIPSSAKIIIGKNKIRTLQQEQRVLSSSNVSRLGQCKSLLMSIRMRRIVHNPDKIIITAASLLSGSSGVTSKLVLVFRLPVKVLSTMKCWKMREFIVGR